MAETLAYQTERSLKEHRSALDESDASTIEGRVMELRQALEGDDISDIKAKTEALQEASHKLAETVYASAQQQAQTAQARLTTYAQIAKLEDERADLARELADLAVTPNDSERRKLEDDLIRCYQSVVSASS